MKKLICMFISALACSYIFAMGIGPQLDITTGAAIDREEAICDIGVSCSMKMDNHPVVIGVATDYSIIQNSFNAYSTVDYWFVNPMLGDYCSFFAGIGEVIGASISEKDAAFTVGARGVFGFNWIFYDGFLEYFVQTAIQPEGRFGNASELLLKFPVNAGIRLYF